MKTLNRIMFVLGHLVLVSLASGAIVTVWTATPVR